jgi:hypothetical protein
VDATGLNELRMKNKTKPASAFHGVFTALVTPMKANEGVDLKTLAQHVETMIAAGIHGLIPLGSTGEFYSLTAEERRDVLKATLEAAGGRVPVVAGTNAGSTRDVVAFSREAEELGCDGVMLAPRYYSLPQPDGRGHDAGVHRTTGRIAARPLRQGKHRRDRAYQHAAAAVWRPIGRVLRRRHGGF